ncbi:MAG: PEGA domain-containing protein [Methanobacteriota archaeon]
MTYPGLIILLLISLLIPPLSAGASGALQVGADLPGVALFLNGTYIGDTPQTISVNEQGEYQIAATLPGRITQEKNITVTNETLVPIFFTFGPGQPEPYPGLIRIHDCVGTPEKTGLYGTSVTVATMSDGTLMAYYSGFGEGVRCAGSDDGSRWHEYPEGCLPVSGNGGNPGFPLTRPWVYASADGGFRMIYLSDGGDGPSLFRASSIDGVTFTPDGKVTINHSPEAAVASPEQESIPTGLHLADGTLRMYYSAPGGGIRSALSHDDGLTWTDEGGFRLTSATDPSIVLFPDNRFGLFYVDLSAGSKGQKLMVTTSSDGLLFNSSDTGAVIESEEKGVWILDPDVYVSKEGRWTLYFSLLGKSGEAGITVPTIMSSVIDPDCLTGRINQNT